MYINGGCVELRRLERDVDDVACCAQCHANEEARITNEDHEVEGVPAADGFAYELCCTMAKALRYVRENV
jgi:hypothetical protein